MMADNIEICCDTCIFFDGGAPMIVGAARLPLGSTAGACSLKPPAVIQTFDGFVSVRPRVMPSNWCVHWSPEFPADDPDGGSEEEAPETNVVPFDAKAAA